jgi:hypothetical protein
MYLEANTNLHNLTCHGPGDTPVPPEFFARFSELAPYKTVGEVRAALQSPATSLASGSPGATDVIAPASGSRSVARVLRLPRDGTVVERLRVVSVTDSEVVLEVHPETPPGGPPSVNAPPTPTPPPSVRQPRRHSTAKTPAATSACTTVATAPVLGPLPEGATEVVQFSADQAELAEAIRTVGPAPAGCLAPALQLQLPSIPTGARRSH